MFRLPLLVLLSLVVAFGGGVWSASRVLKAVSGFGAISLGPWVGYPELQTADADPFAKAHRAGDGRILLGRAEGLVFTAREDQDGEMLSGRCAYEISGQTPPARFWTLRLTDDNDAPLPAAPMFPATLTSWTTLRNSDGTFRITLSATPAPGNWIRLDADTGVAFVLTLIDTPTAGSAGLIDLDMPTIRQIGCRDA
ncbi:DUF1214 domain-containing protein [Hoeflea sp.]|uniref:DUF1214 domain-containing protein n=1 Tax=Hoeflea sp. TaxID=1940281 RepID=UPI0037488A93